MEKVRGLIAAVYTPFDRNGGLALDIIGPYAAYLKRSGVSGVFVNGTTGEGLSLSREERRLCAEAWVAEKEEGFKVMIHVGHNSLPVSRDLARHAAAIGSDSIGAMSTNFFIPGDLSSLVSLNEKIAEAAPGLPYYYYHIPGMTGAHFPMIDFLEQAYGSIPNLAGIKYSQQDLMDLKLCLEFSDRQFDLLFGCDEILVSALILGARGAIGSTYNYMAPLFVRLVEAFDQGDLEEANQLQYLAMKIVKVLMKYGGAIKAGKSFMRHIGLDTGAPRIPITGLEPKKEMQMYKELETLEFSNYTLKVV